MTETLLCLLLLAQPQADQDVEFRARLASTDPANADALLDLGQWCEQRKRPGWAERCYRMVAGLGRGEKNYPESVYRIARLEIDKKLFSSAYRRLRELTSSSTHKAAAALLKRAQTETSRRQRALVAEGDKLYKEREPANARQKYSDAFKLLPEGATSTDFIPHASVLQRLALCADRIDDAHFREVFQPKKRSIRPCQRCTRYGGFLRCTSCGGDGVQTIRVRSKSVKAACKRCTGVGYTFCTSCVGMQYTTEDYKITEKERKALTKVLTKVRDKDVLDRSLAQAVKTVQKLVLGTKEAATLDYFRSVQPKYSLSADLHRKLGSLPYSPAAIKGADEKWKAAQYKLPLKANFMLAFTCEFTSWLTGYDMLRARNKVTNFSEAPTLRSPPATVLSPGLLSAFPDTNTRQWLTVEGMLVGHKIDPAGGNKTNVSVIGSIAHNVHFFTWLPEAKTDLEHLAANGWLLKVGGLPKYYPFEIHKKLAAAPRGHRITLVGRFLRNPLGHPRNWFEIWDLEIGFSPAQEEMYSALKEPVEISFPALELQKLGGFLRWFGLRLELRGIAGNSKLNFEAEGCTVGRLIDRIARTLGSKWYWEKGRVVFSRKVSKQQAEDVKLVLSRLQSEDSGKLLVRSGNRPGTRPAAPPPTALPADGSSLEDLAAGALLSMDYELAGKCYRKLEELPEARTRQVQIRRQRYRVALMSALTRQTPVSQLVGASDLFEIHYRNSAGELLKRTVRILRRSKEHIWIQSGYGEEVRLRRAGIEKETGISREDWHSAKERELQKRAGGLDKDASYGYLGDLFSLALFAKTNKLSKEGTKFLDSAFADKNFAWLLDTYFPADRERLTRYWKKSTGREESLAKNDPPKKQPEKKPPRENPPKKKPPAPASPRPVGKLATNTPLPKNPAALMDYGIRHFRKGREYLSRSLPGMDNAFANKKLARDHFERAQRASQRILDLKPADAGARQLVRRSSLMVHTCAKDMGFFD